MLAILASALCCAVSNEGLSDDLCKALGDPKCRWVCTEGWHTPYDQMQPTYEWVGLNSGNVRIWNTKKGDWKSMAVTVAGEDVTNVLDLHERQRLFGEWESKVWAIKRAERAEAYGKKQAPVRKLVQLDRGK